MKTESEQFVAVSQLKKRGWTDALISEFLGDPDKLRTNPHYRSGPPMKLYKKQRVDQTETSAAFRAAQENRKGKRDAAQKALATKKQKIAEYVATVEIKVPQLTKEELIRDACNNYNPLGTGDNWANEHSDPEFLERLCVNYLRHCLTQYETHLGKIAGRVGVRGAYLEIKTKVLDAISDEYDWLGDECNRQARKMLNQESERT